MERSLGGLGLRIHLHVWIGCSAEANGQRGGPSVPSLSMELYQLKTFVAVAREGNLTRAAERVFTSPPAVSAQLKALEDELGVKLFDRTPRGMTLTEPGQRLLDEAERTLAAAGRMRSAAAQLRGEVQGIVRMGTVSDPVALRLGDALVRLAERHPQVSLQLSQGLSADLLLQVQRGELEAAYAMTDLERMAGLEIQRLGQVELVVGLPMALADAAPSLQALVALPWVGTPPTCTLRQHQERLFAAGGGVYRPGAMADTEGSVRSMVASGLGAGIVRRDQAEEAQRRGELVIWPGWQARTWICWASRPAGQVAPAVQAVGAVVQEVWGA
ncbi:hypothetical protein GCM10009107_41490 [Ideonella azotifigens]|uniref:HTH lysR-type domain-containing protein n=2 Tax=Ideonella azotifigens TaxID=513160 RepID=A0ABN1KA64_9BURK